jgi:hypothetical protein
MSFELKWSVPLCELSLEDSVTSQGKYNLKTLQLIIVALQRGSAVHR